MSLYQFFTTVNYSTLSINVAEAVAYTALLKQAKQVNIMLTESGGK